MSKKEPSKETGNAQPQRPRPEPSKLTTIKKHGKPNDVEERRER